MSDSHSTWARNVATNKFKAIAAQSSSAPSAVAPTDDEWNALKPKQILSSPLVDVLVPVYAGLDETMRCLYSVIASSQKTPYNLLVVNDCSPDATLTQSLRDLSSRGLIELHELPVNGGFVRTCNFGMSLYRDRDVVLLNSDTEVHNDWLDRLRAAAYKRNNNATITPLSNNATICSYPRFIENNAVPLEVSDQELDELAAKCNEDIEIEIPTGVGFCMYVRRQCLEEIGLFDEASFGRGYGEENDLCRRAAKHGWRNVLAANVFVRHYGGISFGSTKSSGELNAISTVERLHPGYQKLIQKFIEQDPVIKVREALDHARLERRAKPAAILFVLHSWGGGTEDHVADLQRILGGERVATLHCKVSASDPNFVVISDPTLRETPNIRPINVAREFDVFVQLLRRFSVRHIHIHHLAGFPPETADLLRCASGAAGIRYDVTIHDYMPVCPRINLIDRSGVYCGEPDLETCERCIARSGSPFGRPSVWHWRDRYERLLTGARRVFVPDIDVQRRIRRFFPSVKMAVKSHPELSTQMNLAGRLSRRDGRVKYVRIALLGALGPHKGSGLLEAVAREAVERKLPMQFVVVGYTDRDPVLRSLGVEILGKYIREEGVRHLADVDADFVWFSSVWPETYSYTLSVAFAAKVCPVAFDLGAIATRIRNAGWGVLLPLEFMLDPAALAHAFLAFRSPQVPESLPGPTPPDQLQDFLTSYYDLSNTSFCTASPKQPTS